MPPDYLHNHRQFPALIRIVAEQKCVGWAKRPGANAFGGVPTTRREGIRFKKWLARRRCVFAPTLRTDQ
jgi:hypothetical protein